MPIPTPRMMPLLRTMLLMRRAEEKMCELGGDEVHGVYHAYIGQEATGAAVMSQLGPDDAMVSTHRNHGHNLAHNRHKHDPRHRHDHHHRRHHHHRGNGPGGDADGGDDGDDGVAGGSGGAVGGGVEPGSSNN